MSKGKDKKQVLKTRTIFVLFEHHGYLFIRGLTSNIIFLVLALKGM